MSSFQKFLLVFFLIGISASFVAIFWPPSGNPKPGSCKILEEKYCQLGRLTKSQNISYMGFNLSPKTALFSPIDGQTSSIKLPAGGTAQGFFVTVLNPNNRSVGSYILTGDIEVPNSGQNIKTGEIIGKIGNTGVKSFGEYNLLINISKVDPATNIPVPHEEKMKQLFPNAYEK